MSASRSAAFDLLRSLVAIDPETDLEKIRDIQTEALRLLNTIVYSRKTNALKASARASLIRSKELEERDAKVFPIIKRLHEVNEFGWRLIALRLNEMNIPPPYSDKWHHTTVRRIYFRNKR
jgi:hypothetical protein